MFVLLRYPGDPGAGVVSTVFCVTSPAIDVEVLVVELHALLASGDLTGTIVGSIRGA
jgi:hypothetical protein